MKKYKISDSEMRLLVLLGALIIVAASYFFGFKKISASAEALEAQNKQDEQKVQQLQIMIASEDAVREQTEKLKEAIQIVIDKYPSDVPEEKAIAIMQDLEDQTEVHIKSINFVMSNAVALDSVSIGDTTAAQGTPTDTSEASDGAAAADAATGTTDESTGTDAGAAATPTASIQGYYDQITVTYECDYDSLKALADYVTSAVDRMTMPSMTAEFDSETGQLSGQMTFNLYYLMNTGREYQPPVIHGVDSGVSDIFRTRGGND